MAGSAHRRDSCSCYLVGPDGVNTVRPRRRRACGELLSYDLRPLSATHHQHLPSWMPLATLLNCSLLIPSRVIHMPIESDNSKLSRRATPQCVTSPSAGRRPASRLFVVLTFAQPTAFTTGCGLVRHSVSSPGTTGSVFFVFGAGLRLCPTRGVAPLLPRHGAPQRSPLLVQGRQWLVVA